MDTDRAQNLFDDKYQKGLGMSYQEWLETAPQTEVAAYKRLDEINRELHRTYDLWFEATGDEKDRLEEYREKLKLEYDLLEELYGLELSDRNN
jgi:hypothetical protein